MISFFTQDIEFKLFHKRHYINWFKDIISLYEKKQIEINIIFCSDPYLLYLNRHFLGHDYCTDVISFDYTDLDSNNQLHGDIFISIDTVRINAKRYKATSFDEELLRVMAHGLFHLLGFKDDSKKEKLIMREREAYAIKLFENHYHEHKV